MFLDDRKKALEDKFFHDEEQHFLENARHIKAIGIWIAEKLELDDKAEIAYVQQIISLTLDDSSGETTLQKIENDLHTASLSLTEEEKKKIISELKKQ